MIHKMIKHKEGCVKSNLNQTFFADILTSGFVNAKGTVVVEPAPTFITIHPKNCLLINIYIMRFAYLTDGIALIF